MPGDNTIRSTPTPQHLTRLGVPPNVAGRDDAVHQGEPVDPSTPPRARPRPADGRFPGGRASGPTLPGTSSLAPMRTLPTTRINAPSRLTPKQAEVLNQAQHALKQARKFESGTHSKTQEKARKAARHLFEGGDAPTGPELIALHAGGHLEAAELQDALSLSALFAPDDVSHASMLLLAKHLGSGRPDASTADDRSAGLLDRLRVMNGHPDVPPTRGEPILVLLAHLEGPWKTDGFQADAQALDKLSDALAGARRVGNVKSQPVLSDFIARMEPELGKEDTETSKIWANIFDSNGDLKVDALEAQFKTSTVPSIFRALNQASWYGAAASDRAYTLEQALTAAKVSVVRGKEPAPELMTPMALSSLHFMKTFEPYLRNLSADSMRLQRGRLPPIQVANLGRFSGPDAQTETSFVGGLKISTISLGKHLDKEGVQHFLPHEQAHAFESLASLRGFNASGMPPSFLRAIIESTADYIQGLVNHMKGNYEVQYGATRMVEAVIAQIQKAKGLHGESTAIGLDVLLRAHLGNDHEACQELVTAWKQVLQMPEYQDRYAGSGVESGVSTLIFAGMVAAIGAAVYLKARQDAS